VNENILSLGAVLYHLKMAFFCYFLVNADNTKVKLAFGEQNAIWVKRDLNGKPVPAPFPAVVQEALHKAISKK